MNITKTYKCIIISVVFLFVFSASSFAQIVHNDQADPTIVHNDQTGIVMEVIEKNKNQNIIKIRDNETGRIYQSQPTHLQINPNDKVIYRPICHCTCTIMSVCKD